MAEERKPSSTAGQPADTALDTLNEELETKRDEPRAIRRRIEATIESKARKRRKNEAPVSSRLKTTGPS